MLALLVLVVALLSTADLMLSWLIFFYIFFWVLLFVAAVAATVATCLATVADHVHEQPGAGAHPEAAEVLLLWPPRLRSGHYHHGRRPHPSQRQLPRGRPVRGTDLAPAAAAAPHSSSLGVGL